MNHSLAFRLLSGLAIIGVLGCGGGDNPASTSGFLSGSWTGCLSPELAISVQIEHSAGSSNFSGSVTTIGGTFPISGGIVTGSAIQFGVVTPNEQTVFSATLEQESNKSVGTWINANQSGTLVFSGEFQMVRDASGATGGCTEPLTQHFPDVQLVGQLGIDGTSGLARYSGTIKNHGIATAEDPRVFVSSFDAAGNLIETDSSVFITLYLAPNETASFTIYSNTPIEQIDTTSVDTGWDGPAPSAPRVRVGGLLGNASEQH